MTKNQILGLTAVALVVVTLTAVAGVVGITQVGALINSGKVPSIITNLAEKFNLKESDVQKVFEDTRTEQEDERLSQLVTDGKITEAQKTLITAKRAEIETKVEEINSKQMTTTERADALKALMDDVEKWAEDNDIEERFLMARGMGRGLDRDLNSGAAFGGRMGGPMGVR
jgi:hypothetical protein